MKKTYHIQLFLLILILSINVMAMNKGKKDIIEKITLHLVLADGFIPDEPVRITIIDNKGKEKEFFNGQLERLNHQDENFFKIQIEKGKYNLLKLYFTARNKEIKHGFIISNDGFIELSVNLKNEFLFITMDSLFGYD